MSWTYNLYHGRNAPYEIFLLFDKKNVLIYRLFKQFFGNSWSASSLARSECVILVLCVEKKELSENL